MARVTSRAPSAGFRAGSVARDITKRRDKLYKTEQSRVLVKKKKPSFRTTYRSAPPGYQFVPVGTYELSERCKELSRQRGLPVTIVNGDPVSKNARDPEKVSHHIARIGWHFPSEVVEQACNELHYHPMEGRFVKEVDLQAEMEQSKMAKTMAKHGMRLDQTVQRETDDQVRAAIKELFPKIPDDDLREILNHAWAKDSHRVGTNTLLDLPRRVQLATIARIRHQYTDYDRLLRAFDWAEARREVEPVCLAKLIEWRGENDQQDDNEFEEIVRETIVIDDDEDSPDEDSDTSMEISHRPALEADLAAESHDEGSTRLLDRYQARPRNVQQRNFDVRQKIGAVREQLRNGDFVMPPRRLPTPPMTANVIRINLPENGDVVQIGGKTFRRATPATPIQLQPGPLSAYEGSASSRNSYACPQSAYPVDTRPPHERPVASIESSDDLRRVALAPSGHRRLHSDDLRASGRRHSEHELASNGSQSAAYQPHYSPMQVESIANGSAVGAHMIVDLTAESPQRRHPGIPVLGDHGPPQGIHERSSVQTISGGRYGDSHFVSANVQPVPSSAQQRFLPSSRTMEHAWNKLPQEPRSGPVDAQVAPIQYMPRAQPGTNTRPYPQTSAYPTHVSYQHSPPFGVAQQTKVIYVPDARPPQPVHGAPAAVQQIHRPFNVSGQPPTIQEPGMYQMPGARPMTAASHGQYYSPR